MSTKLKSFLCCGSVIISMILISGTIMYLTNCNDLVNRPCNINEIPCLIKNHYIEGTNCDTDDDIYDIYDDNTYPCYSLNLLCEIDNYSCYSSVGYFTNYVNAEDFFKNHFYHNQTIISYFTKSNSTCSFTKINDNSPIVIYGFSLIIIGSVLFIIVFSIYFYAIYRIRQRQRFYASLNNNIDDYLTENNNIINEQPPKYVE